DRDTKFSADVVSTVKAIGSQPVRTAFRSPWQNGIAERWVGSVRRDLLDHVIVLNRKHLRRLLNEYARYYHEDRTHLGLGKDTPGGRVPASGWSASPLHSRGLTISSSELNSFPVRI
ncbi:MAG: integrase core domain-containing protein, partial [Candidatus Korobacteraceae bacterium]